jgi:hypothetical protein
MAGASTSSTIMTSPMVTAAVLPWRVHVGGRVATGGRAGAPRAHGRLGTEYGMLTTLGRPDQAAGALMPNRRQNVRPSRGRGGRAHARLTRTEVGGRVHAPQTGIGFPPSTTSARSCRVATKAAGGSGSDVHGHASAAVRVLRRDRAAVCLGDRADDRQPQPRAAPVGTFLCPADKRIEHGSEEIVRESGP